MIKQLLRRIPRRRWYTMIYSVRHHPSGIPLAHGMRDRTAFCAERALLRVQRELAQDYAGRATEAEVWILRG